MKSVESINLCKSVIQTNYDIIKALCGDIKVETKEKGTDFIDQPIGRLQLRVL
jgi:hypothetical protein